MHGGYSSLNGLIREDILRELAFIADMQSAKFRQKTEEDKGLAPVDLLRLNSKSTA